MLRHLASKFRGFSGVTSHRSPEPVVTTLNDPQGLIVANAAVVPAGASSGGIGVYNAGTSTTDVVIDMNGYFAAPATLQFYPIAPYRLVDTRGAAVEFKRYCSVFGAVHTIWRNSDDPRAIRYRGQHGHDARAVRRWPCSTARVKGVSIHAANAEGDLIPRGIRSCSRCFNPRPPRGGRREYRPHKAATRPQDNRCAHRRSDSQTGAPRRN